MSPRGLGAGQDRPVTSPLLMVGWNRFQKIMLRTELKDVNDPASWLVGFANGAD
jgi:hypothetical protein